MESPVSNMTERFEAFNDIVDFVEDRGGSMGGEERDALYLVVARYVKAIVRDAMAME